MSNVKSTWKDNYLHKGRALQNVTVSDRAEVIRTAAKEDAPMSGSRISQLGLFAGLMCAAVWAFAQTGQNPSAQETPVVRATTRLVVVNVVVHDKKGAPVSGLTRDDFTVLDGGRKQEVSIFSVESGKAVHAPSQPLPPNTFSNHVNREGGVPTSVAVILLDGLNTRFEDLAFARRQLIEFLSELQPQDRVALYVLGRQLRVVQDFTSDPSPLLEALRPLGTVPSAGGLNEAPASSFPGLSGPAAEAATRFESSVADWMNAGPNLYRALSTSEAIEAIANHLSGLSGRKSLIWVTGSVPDPEVFSPVDSHHLLYPDPRLAESYARMVHALNEADVAIYPVDARGLFVDPAFHAASGAYGGGLALSSMNHEISNMMDFAQQTGGRAFCNTNGLKGSLRSALDDSNLTYTLGYYPSGVRWNGLYRSIKVQVDRSGVQVRHRRGYLATAGAPPEKTGRRALLQEAVASPLDATTLGLTATLKPLENSGESKFQITVLIDPGVVTFQPTTGARSVWLDLFAGRYSNQGKPLGGVIKTISVDLNQSDYEKIVRAGGFKVTFDYNVKPGAVELRVVACDLLSGSIGSLHIPLDQLVLRSR